MRWPKTTYKYGHAQDYWANTKCSMNTQTKNSLEGPSTNASQIGMELGSPNPIFLTTTDGPKEVNSDGPFDNLINHPFLLWNLLFGFPSLQIVWKLKSISLIFFSYFFEVWAILPLRMIDWLQINIEFVRFIPVFPRYNSRWNIGRINIILEYLWVILYREIKMMLR